LAVFRFEVVFSYLERLVHAFTDSDSEDDDELALAEAFVLLVHRLDAGVGLTDPGLHFDGQIAAPGKLL
jgi:hypothetical protein